MQHHNQARQKPNHINWLVTMGVGAVLLFFFYPLLAIIFYGAAGGVMGGAVILSPLILVQYVVYRSLRRWSPNVTLGKPDENSSDLPAQRNTGN